ncbi:MAG: phage integrase SAM-like domain-containing protein, partial [Clostridia bacterium]|nr:phage integrase SAM-like domain-containing protein [Clostridia bacterium]
DLETLNKIIDNLKSQPNADENIQFVLRLADESLKAETLQELIQSGQSTALTPSNDKQDKEAKFGLKFTTKEIDQMPKTFKKEFRAEGCTARIRKRQTGKNSYTYEIRYRRNGYNITITDKNLENGKSRFLAALKTAKPIEKGLGVPTTFHEFSIYYFENFRKRKVAKQTYENDFGRYKNHIKPYYESVKIKDINPDACQKHIDTLSKKSTKTSVEVYGLMSVIFKAAIAHGIIEKNPLSIVLKPTHQCEHGVALTKEEEKLLLQGVKGTKYEYIFALALYTGLRPNELEMAKIEGDFIVAKNSKRKGGKVEYKKIPICEMLKPYLAGMQTLDMPTLEYVRYSFNNILPNHILYDLRTTFYTRCEECGVAEPARDEFVGHSRGKLNNAYSDLSDEYLLKEGKKLVW